MVSILAGAIPWHDGEDKMHRLLRVPEQDNPTAPYLTVGAQALVQSCPLVAVGTVDSEGRPWSSLWGGQAGFAGPVAQSMIGLRAQVDGKYDPVVQALLGHPHVKEADELFSRNTGNMVSALAIDLESRRRVKLFGRMVGGSLDGGDMGEAQLVVKIEESMGNCPKYLNRKHIVPERPSPKLISESAQLHPAALDLLSRADTIFVSSSHGTASMDTNIRGGPPGFVRVEANEANGAVLVYPEYSGNRLYQTLGNLQTTPLAGYVIPDFETGDVLYITGHAEVLVGREAAAVLPRSNLAIRVIVAQAIFVKNGLAFRGQPGEPSPYNPVVRYLTSEKNVPGTAPEPNNASTMVRLMDKEYITPSIIRFRFRSTSSNPVSWAPGQYATLSFQDELDMGYSHMRDDDPTSLNDDFIRTFTVSSYPGRNMPVNEFELMVRRHGNVTNHLFRISERAGLEVPLKGFGGSFRLPTDGKAIVPYIAGGIGITPLLGQLADLEIARLRLFWSVSIRDIGLVQDTFQRWPELPVSTTLFLTGPALAAADPNQTIWSTVQSSGARVEQRRMQAGDLDLKLADTWYLCSGVELKRNVLNWLVGKVVVYEDFNY
ncbi:Riboflavin synthase-like beta-barrel [Penicillium canariense]|uniref:Riboflavin synthase-like beta-barrel n=1 Tax=Penicillium canariense TaxID=189055 RepID=A0A9W9I8G4_9EURO|nr:Riboflavin synthase-like beta-barrel [Penicillium canariense]KAJ5168679.1 Riboflavin synthase-like beta-barrel [Penicillium canariense]